MFWFLLGLLIGRGRRHRKPTIPGLILAALFWGWLLFAIIKYYTLRY